MGFWQWARDESVAKRKRLERRRTLCEMPDFSKSPGKEQILASHLRAQRKDTNGPGIPFL